MLRIQLLGSFQITDDAKSLTRLQSDGLQALMAYSEHDLASDEAARIYRETEGNPLFVVEMIPAGGRTTDQTTITTEQALPPKVQATIQYRLSQLSANAQGLIQFAAVIGRNLSATCSLTT